MCTSGICRPSVGRYYRPIWRPTLGRYIDRHSADMSAETRSSVGRHEPTSMSADTRPILHRHSAATRPPLGRHSATTRPPLGRYFTNTQPTLSSLGQLLLPPEFYIPCSTERGFSVAVVLFWPLTPAIFMSFFQLCFFLVIAFIYDRRYFRM